MAIRGRDRFENLSAVRQLQDGSTDYGAPRVRFGEYAVPPRVAWVLEPIGRSPAVRAEFEMRRGRPICTSLCIEARPGGEPVTTGSIEMLPGLDKKAAEAFKAMAIRVFDDEDWRAGKNLHRRREIHNPDPRSVATALRGHTDEELAEVARVYRENVDARPAEAVEIAMGYPSRRTADRRIQAARRRGFLPPTTRGKRKA